MTQLFDPAKLIQFRTETFWTQEELAAASGLSPRTIQRLEQTGRGSVESWKAVAAAFNITPENLMTSSANLIDQFESHQLDMRRAVIGAVLCCAAGLVGCSFGWYLIFTGPADYHEAVTQYAPLTASVTFATAVCFIVPIVTWRRTLR